MDLSRREMMKILGFSATVPFFPKANELSALANTRFCEMSDSHVVSRLDSIFEPIKMRDCEVPEFPTDFFAPGVQTKPISYIMPEHGKVGKAAKLLGPDGTYIHVPDYPIETSIDWPKGQLMVQDKESAEIHCIFPEHFIPTQMTVVNPVKHLEDHYVESITDEQWRLLLSAAKDRNITVLDQDVQSGMSKRLISLMKVVMRRNGGGNPGSTLRGRMTDLYIGHDVWDKWRFDRSKLTQIEQREITLDKEDRLLKTFGVNIWPLKKLDRLYTGVDSYQNFYTNDLKGTMHNSKNRLVIGIDKSRRDSFIMPYFEYWIRREDRVELLKHHKTINHHGMRLLARQGLAVMDNRAVLLGTI